MLRRQVLLLPVDPAVTGPAMRSSLDVINVRLTKTSGTMSSRPRPASTRQASKALHCQIYNLTHVATRRGIPGESATVLTAIRVNQIEYLDDMRQVNYDDDTDRRTHFIGERFIPR
ncbi:hypothetical protein AYX19_13765 [Paenarthrobacter ureafaciens]|nr:hypothetical protein AYX19_13765 [Paenarthrobacter ureafaciens]